MLELDVIGDRLIGSEKDGGLSLEQRKRTTLGVELAANPSLVFLDEPTSGLDARSAQVTKAPSVQPMNALCPAAAELFVRSSD